MINRPNLAVESDSKVKMVITSSLNLFKILMISCLLVTATSAEDVEIYGGNIGDSTDSSVYPNVLIVIDTSQSMDGEVDVNVWDPTVTYTAPVDSPACDPARIYVEIDDIAVTECDTDYWFEAAKFRCDRATVNLDLDGNGEGTGFYNDQIARWDSNYESWFELDRDFPGYRSDSLHYECEYDNGRHGEFDGSPDDYIRNGSAGPFSSSSGSCSWWDWNCTADVPWNGVASRTLYTANYLHWYRYHGGAGGTIKTRLEVVVDAAKAVFASVTDINLAIMRYDDVPVSNGENHGGPVVLPFGNIDDPTFSGEIISTLDALTTNGYTPLAETVYEGMNYYRGEDVYFGLPQPGGVLSSHAGSRTGATYNSPISYDCGKNYMIVFSDGAPTNDDEADNFIDSLLTGGTEEFGNCGMITTTNCTTIDPEPTCGWVYPEGCGWFGICNENDPRIWVCDDPDPYEQCDNPVTRYDACLDELAWYMNTADHATEALGNDLPGTQKITSYYVGGFGVDDGVLDAAAAAGGTNQAYSAANPSEFANVFTDIINQIQRVNVSFASPAVSVNALNRLKHNNDLYFALFEPNETPHWNGNLKKYRLESTGTDSDGDGENDLYIADASTPPKPAVNANTGLFEDNALSYWFLDANISDGDETTQGGAAHRLFDYDAVNGYDPESRDGKVFTYLTDYAPDDSSFDGSGIALIVVREENADVTGVDPEKISKSDLGFSEAFDDAEFLKRVNWLAGADSKDDDLDGNTTEARPVMGGVLHTEPALINYAIDDNGTLDPSDDTQTNVLLTTTNDGYLHIFKTETTDPDDLTRLEHSAVIPKPTLGLMEELYNNEPGDVVYRLDSNINIWRYESFSDSDDDITTDGDDHVYAYFGQRRGGNVIFAFDLTNPDEPKLLWEINPENVPENSTDAKIGPFQYMGQSWSKPTHHTILHEIEDPGDALTAREIVIFGGGYDVLSDDLVDATRSEDFLGNTIYIVDAKTGELLWWAGKTGVDNVTPNFSSSDMKYGFTADIRIVDINGDGIADKFFATDAGGQVWRFDINNVLNAGSDLSLTARINGGVIADLQLVDDTDTESNTNNRRLYYPPDVSISQPDDSEAPSLFISVGSGFRAHPLNGTIIDHFFVLKFPDIFQNTDFDTLEPLYIGDLLDISNLNFAADPPPVITETEGVNLKNNGWYIVFPDDGEKSLSESITAAGIVIFTTYTPPANDELPADQQSCTGNQGTGKIYAVSIVDGRPVANLDGIGAVNDLTLSDRSYATKAVGIPPRPKIIFPDFDNVSGKLIVGREIVPLNIPSTPELAYWIQQGVR